MASSVIRNGRGPVEAPLRRHTPWRGGLPDLIFPDDRSWLVTIIRSAAG
jgi:hypothetical protein